MGSFDPPETFGATPKLSFTIAEADIAADSVRFPGLELDR
jgi:hypothetical protein